MKPRKSCEIPNWEVATLLKLSSQKHRQMEKFKEQILQNAVQMDASVNFNVNGNMTVIPCPWEDGKEVTNGKSVNYEGSIRVEPNGLTRVTRWNRGSRGPLHDTLFETPHGAVKMTRPQIRPSGRRRIDEEFVYVTFKFPKKYGLALTKALYQEEADEIMSYFKTRKEETIWSR